MKYLCPLVSIDLTKFVYQHDILSGVSELNENDKKIKKNNDENDDYQTRDEKRREIRYKREVKESVYDNIVSEGMDLPDSDFDKIKNIPKDKIRSLAQRGIAVESYLSGDVEKKVVSEKDLAIMSDTSDVIGGVDTSDIMDWLGTTNGKEFLNGDYKDLSDYLEKKTQEEFDFGKKGFERKNNIISEEMDLPASDFYRISKVPKGKIKEIFNSNSEEASFFDSESLLRKKYEGDFGGIGSVDINDFGNWLKTENGKKFLNGNYTDLSDYLKKRVGNDDEK